MDDRLKYKLTRFEASPPKDAWDNISKALDNDQTFSERLYQYAETPPADNWNAIYKELNDEVAPAKVVPFSIRFKKPIRYAAAAAVIGIILTVSTLLLKRTEAGALQAGSGTTVPVRQAHIPLPGPNTVLQNNRTTALMAAPMDNFQKTSTFKKRLLRLIQPQKLFTSIAIGKGFMPKKISKPALFTNASLSNYMVFSDDSGLAMRMPKKLFPLVQCDDGDASCRQRIRDLQQKLSSSALATDFTAILEMLRQVQ